MSHRETFDQMLRVRTSLHRMQMLSRQAARAPGTADARPFRCRLGGEGDGSGAWVHGAL